MLFRFLRHASSMFPLSLQGILTLGLTTYALRRYAYGSQDLVVFAIGICALAILVFSLFCTIVSGVLVQRRIHRKIEQHAAESSRLQLEAGFPNESGFQLSTLNYFPLIRLSWKASYPDLIETRIRVTMDNEGNTLLREELLPHRRFLSDSMQRQFTVSDVLGFARYTWRETERCEYLCLPQMNTLKQLPLLRSMTAEDGMPDPGGSPEGDRMEIRRYAPGDSVRDIMWKAYARSGQLNVRLAEKSVFHSQRTLAYLLSSKHDEAAAATARVALQRGVFGEDWLFGADGSRDESSDLTDALRVVAASRAVDREHPYGLDNFLQAQSMTGASHCIVFAAAERGSKFQRLLSTLQNHPGRISLILAVDALSENISSSLWRRILMKSPGKDANSLEYEIKKADLIGILTDLSHFVESVLVIERRTGLCFDERLRKV